MHLCLQSSKENQNWQTEAKTELSLNRVFLVSIKSQCWSKVRTLQSRLGPSINKASIPEIFGNMQEVYVSCYLEHVFQLSSESQVEGL